MKIHKEGTATILVVFLALVLINAAIMLWADLEMLYSGLISGLSIGFFAFILHFFRSPNVRVNLNEKQILAPADGKVVVIEKTREDEYFDGEEKIQISIFMSPLNVHVNRNPVTGLIKYFKYHPGKYLVAWHPKSSTENERTTLVYEVHKGVEILVRQIAGVLARRIKWYVEEEQCVIQGKEFGFIKFGSRVDLFLPLDAEVKVSLGQVTKGGVTILAELL